MNDDRRFGQRAGIRWAISWLHKRAGEMNDPNAKTVLNTAAFQMGVEAKNLQIVESPAPSDGDGWRTMGSAPRDGTPIVVKVLGTFAVVTFDANPPKHNEWKVSLCEAWIGTEVTEGWTPVPAGHDLLPPLPMSEPSDEGR